MLILVAVIWIKACRQRIHQAEWRVAAAITGTLWTLAELMNLYHQPQDPQFQIQPMLWFALAAGSAYAAVNSWRPTARVAARASMAAATAMLLVFNVAAYAGWRHADSDASSRLAQLESLTNPSETVFLIHGFEPMATWLTVAWGRGAAWPGTDRPLDHGRNFKVINIVHEPVTYPSRSPEQAAEDIVARIVRALDEGFNVVSNDYWDETEAIWVASFGSVSTPETPKAIRAALRGRFTAVPIGRVEGWGTFYRISKSY